MIVTDLDYFLENPKLNVLNWLIDRVTGERHFQNVIITDGMEGYGKSTLTAADAYYMAYSMRRPLRLFFDIEKMTSYSLETKDQVIIWDDAALSGLSLESYNSAIIRLIKLLLLARKKRHTYFINIQEIFRLKEPLVGRAVAMNHVYSPDGLKLGKYTYHNESQMKFLYTGYITRKRKSYKYYSFKGGFPKVLYKIFDEKQYETLKDAAIMSIKDTRKSEMFNKKKADTLQKKIAEYALKKQILPEIAEAMGINERTIYKWADKEKQYGDGGLSPEAPSDNYNYGYVKPMNESYLKLPPVSVYNPLSNKQKERTMSAYSSIS